jgi:hypothetical protein
VLQPFGEFPTMGSFATDGYPRVSRRGSWMDRYVRIPPPAASGIPAPSLSMTPRALGEHLAHLVWESFSDFLTDEEPRKLMSEMGLTREEGLPDERVAGELLIFHLWSHTRAVQLAFVGTPAEARLRETLDALHHAFFQDMVENGTPEAHLPVFEQRVSARYSEYYAAAEYSDARVGQAVLAHLVPRDQTTEGPPTMAQALTERAIELANPLRDFLRDVELSET